MHRGPAGGDVGPVLDARARAAYRARHAELEAELEDAVSANDLGRRDRITGELAFFERQLARAVGLGGRVRLAGSPAESARLSVTRTVRAAIARLRTVHAALGEHLDRTIRTGSFCAYVPDPRVAAVWDVEG
jgi:enamine deaminase RidA (YjgF/YER057c/UK114 family)